MKGLFQKLGWVQKEIKGLAVDTEGHGYKYLSGNKILSIVRPLLDQAGLLLLPSITEANYREVEYKTKNGPKMETMVEISLTFTWVDTETGDQFVQDWKQHAMNGFDKGIGSALTYAERYFIMKTFHLQTDADDIEKIARKVVTDKPASKDDFDVLKMVIIRKKIGDDMIQKMVESYGKKEMSELTAEDVKSATVKLNKMK